VSNPSTYDANEIITSGIRGQRGDVNAIATKGENQIQVLLWHYHDVAEFTPNDIVSLKVSGLPIGQEVQISESRIDEHHGNAYTYASSHRRKKGSVEVPVILKSHLEQNNPFLRVWLRLCYYFWNWQHCR